MAVHDTVQVENSELGDAEVREYVTIHDSTVDSGVRIYERTSIKKSAIAGPTDVNANCYVEGGSTRGEQSSRRRQKEVLDG